MTAPRKRELVLAIYPYRQGVTYTLFEAPLSPVDWSIKKVGDHERNSRSLAIVRRLIEAHHPDVLVLEEYAGSSRKRGDRVMRLNELIRNYALGQAVETHAFARADIAEAFSPAGAKTRHEIARVIAAQIEAFAHRLPPVRKAWMDQDIRMTLFNAASLAWTYYALRDRRD
jgi:hypothetical protein